MELDIHRLWVFKQVVECGGFSAAAQRLYMSQPSVSNQVRQLERSLQVTLVDRSAGRTRPTAEGEVLAKYADRVFLMADEAVAAVRQVSDLEAGSLTVGGTTTIGSYLLPILLARFRERYPAVEGNIYVGNLDQVERALLDGEFGIAMVAGEPSAKQLACVRVFDERMKVIADPRHRLAGRAVAPTELADERFLLREPGSQTRREQETALASWGLDTIKRGDFWGPEAIKQSVAAGLGVSLLSEHAVARELATGELASVQVDPQLPARSINLAYRSDRLMGPAESAFVNLLREVSGWPDADEEEFSLRGWPAEVRPEQTHNQL